MSRYYNTADNVIQPMICLDITIQLTM
jgi:hypothetical protein